MIRVVTYDQIDRTAWQELVRKSKTGTWFQSPEAYDFFASMPEVMEAFVIAVERVKELTNEGTLYALCVGYVTKERNPIKQFFTRRAIINGGPCLADDATNEEVEKLMQAVTGYGLQVTGNPIYIETRNFNDYSRWREAFEQAGFSYKKHLNFHIDCSSAATIEAHLSDVRKRQIRKATRNGAIIIEATTEQEVRDWYNILAPLYRQKVKTPLFPWSFFLTFFRNGVGKYLLVKHEGKVIGGIMIVELTNERMNELTSERGCVYEWFVCGLDTDYHDQYPSVMSTYAAMDYAAKHDLARFDVMGAGKPNVPYGVRDFKAEFGGQLVEHGRFLHICQPFLYRIGTLGVRLLKQH